MESVKMMEKQAKTNSSLIFLLLYFVASALLVAFFFYKGLPYVKHITIFNTLSGDPILLTLFVLAYSIVGGTVAPLPVEAPLVLYGKVPLAYILIPTAIGRGIGAFLICKGWTLLDVLFKSIKSFNVFSVGDRIYERIENKGFAAYFLMQSIPFLPLRSSIYAYAYIDRNYLKVILGAAIGSVFRDIIMLLLFMLGYVTFKSII